MATKDELVSNIKGWMKVDEEIRVLSKEIKERRERKKEYADALVGIMKENEIDCFDMNAGKIIYTRNKVRAPLSKKHLLSCLEQYATANPECNLPVGDVGQFIMDSRESKLKEGIRHKPQKNV
tara:strand:+ start:1116 stop:1484 length:369 start_codon:yes stop_codon:yes gene_type:complete